MSRQKVLITGGAGFIGSHCVLTFLENHFDVIIVDNFSNSSQKIIPRIRNLNSTSSKLFVYDNDILNINSLSDIFEHHPHISCILHLAGLKSVNESVSNPLKYYSNNVTGLLNILSMVKKYNISKFIFSSSATVYGNPSSLPLTEKSSLRPINPYGKTKLICEQILQDFTNSVQNFKVITLRYFNPIGSHPSGQIGEEPKGIPNNLMPYITQVIIGKQKYLKIFGNDYDTHDGTGVRDYIHVVDLANGHLAAFKRLLSPNCNSFEVYNLGTGKGYSVLDILEQMSKIISEDIPYKIVERRNGDCSKIYTDPSFANKNLNWSAKYNLKDMCYHSWKWQKLNPNGYDSQEKKSSSKN